MYCYITGVSYSVTLIFDKSFSEKFVSSSSRRRSSILYRNFKKAKCNRNLSLKVLFLLTLKRFHFFLLKNKEKILKIGGLEQWKKKAYWR